MSRYLAAFYHFCISFVVFIFLAYLVLFVWYPDFFYTIDGGWEGMRIIIGVDLVLGPVLTLIVFKAGKPGLKFDLTCVAVFQSVCLAAGVYVVYSERPLFFIYYDQHFYSASADTYTRYNQATPDPLQFDVTTPAMVISKVPDNPIEEADFRSILYKDDLPVWAYSRSYQPFDDHIDAVLQDGFPLDELRERDTEGRLDEWLAEYGGSADDYAFYPIHSRYRDPFIGIRRSDKTIVDILEVAAPLDSASAEAEG